MNTPVSWAQTADILKSDYPTQVKCFTEEYNEYQHAINDVERLDALADMNQVIACLMVSDPDADLTDFLNDYLQCEDDFLNNGYPQELIQQACEVVTESNFSKFCKTVEDAQDSVDKYAKMGIKATFERTPEWYVIRCAEDVKVDGKYYPKCKILKGIHYVEPNLEPLFDALNR